MRVGHGPILTTNDPLCGELHVSRFPDGLAAVLDPLAGLLVNVALVALKVALLAGEGVTEVVKALLGFARDFAGNSFDVVARIVVAKLALAHLLVLFSTCPASHCFTSL